MGLPEFCDNVAAKMTSLTGNREMEGRIAFGLEILISFMLSVAAMVVISSIFGVLRPALIFAAIVFVIKTVIGGAHLSYPLRCAVFGALVVTLIVKFVPMRGFTQDTLIILFTISTLLIMIHAPAESPEKPLSQRQKRRLRAISIALSVLLLLASMFVSFPSGGMIAVAMLWQSLMITPAGFRIIATMDRVFDRATGLWSGSNRRGRRCGR